MIVVGSTLTVQSKAHYLSLLYEVRASNVQSVAVRGARRVKRTVERQNVVDILTR